MHGTASAPPVVLPQAHELVDALLALRNAAESVDTYEPHLHGRHAINRGRLIEAIEQADTALFNILNTAHNLCYCPAAGDAVARWLTRRYDGNRIVMAPAPDSSPVRLAAAAEPAEAPAPDSFYAVCGRCGYQAATSTVLALCPGCNSAADNLVYFADTDDADTHARWVKGA